MGVTGSGKTTVGRMLAEYLGCEFVDADDYHPASNIEKMRAGHPLNDDDRQPWLEILREILIEKPDVVLACSALKKAYRDVLRFDDSVRLVYLRNDRETIRERLDHRQGHFMNPGLIDSQFDTLEEPVDAITIDASGSQSETVDAIMLQLADKT